MPTRVVSAVRSLMAESEVSANIAVITAADLAKLPASTLAEVLHYLPEVYVEFNGGLGSDASGVRIQGSEIRHVAIYQDGVPLNLLANPRTDLSYLPIGAIQRIEIYKGAASSAWGSALGGVINLITKTPDSDKPANVSARVSYGEFQTLKTRAEINGTTAGFGYLISGLHEESDGFTENTQYEQNAFYAKFNYLVGETGRINFVFSHNEGDNGDPVTNFAEFWDDVHRRRTYQRLLFETALTDETLLVLEARHHQFANTIEDVFIDHRELFNDYEDEIWGLSARLTWDISSNNVLNAGFDGDWGTYDWANYTQEYDTGYWAAYVNDTHTMGHLTANAGLRYDHNRDFGSALSPSGGITLRFFKDQALLRAQVAKGFSAPPAAWLDDPTFGNPDLKPETALNYQLGGQATFFKSLDIKVNLFHAKVEELINFDFASRRYQNIDSVIRRGIEWSAAWRSDFGLTLSISGSHVDVENENTGRTIEDIPQNTYNVSALYANRFMSHSLLGRYIDHNSSFPETRDKQFVFDYKADFQLPVAKQHGQWHVFVNVYNLFDSYYIYRDVWPKPGRWVEGGIRIQF